MAWARGLVLAVLVAGAGVSSAQGATPVANGGFAFVAPNARIVTALPDGSGRVQVSHGPGKDLDPAISSDGTKIAFDSTRTGGGDIYVMNADGSGVVRLTTDIAEDSQPAWSPDGARIAFTRCGTVNCNIWVMTSAGANPHPITNGRGGALETDPAWSPDGQLIAFRAILHGGLCNRIWVVHPNGTGPRALTSCHRQSMGGTQDFSPTWSPDGRQIAFDRSYEATLRLTIDRILIMKRDGSGKHFVTPLAMTAFGPAWSPDGGQIAFSRRVPHVETDTMIMRPDGRDAIVVARHTREPAWRPVACTIVGTSGPDHLIGTPGNDVICGLGGPDLIAGRGGQDVISGGRGGHDTVSYQWLPRPGLRVRVAFRAYARGTEFLSGIEDVIGSRWEDDTIHGGDVPNILRGMAGADFVIGGPGRDHLYGGPGDDTVDGHDSMPGDVVYGGVGLDVCHADPGDLVRSC
jgi:Tol biopolymer transport system component